jgi:hypothetical protein
MNVGSTSVDHPPALQAVFYCGVYGSQPGIASFLQTPAGWFSLPIPILKKIKGPFQL